ANRASQQIGQLSNRRTDDGKAGLATEALHAAQLRWTRRYDLLEELGDSWRDDVMCHRGQTSESVFLFASGRYTVHHQARTSSPGDFRAAVRVTRGACARCGAT